MTVLEIEETNEWTSPKGKGLNNKRRSNLQENLPSKKFAPNMSSGDYRGDSIFTHTPPEPPESPVATISNMGNTCFLNSVLYTLRFAPTFLHNLHHLIADLIQIDARLAHNRAKSSSLGRGGTILSGPSSRSISSKDLLSLDNLNDIIPKSKVQIVTEKLHELFFAMHGLELKESTVSHQPLAFLKAVKDANIIFEGNHQQDAHELLVYLLDNIRETCAILSEQIRHQPQLVDATDTPYAPSLKRWKRLWKDSGKREQNGETTSNGNADVDDNDQPSRKIGYNFVGQDFQGITLRRTKCLECECVTERKEPFYDIPVPITKQCSDIDNPEEIYKIMCVTSEKLCDTNKYFCDNCNRYNEARRDVSFEKLPNIMVLQLKRFTASNEGVEKVTTYLPTPLTMPCFCEDCQHNDAIHRYQLCCIIMHLGATMASGHYIAYVRASEHAQDYAQCKTPMATNNEKSAHFLNFLKPRTSSSKSEGRGEGTCNSRECCGVRLNLPYGTHNHINEDVWLECDDEKIRSISSSELIYLLGDNTNSTATPYLLFYSKIT